MQPNWMRITIGLSALALALGASAARATDYRTIESGNAPGYTPPSSPTQIRTSGHPRRGAIYYRGNVRGRPEVASHDPNWFGALELGGSFEVEQEEDATPSSTITFDPGAQASLVLGYRLPETGLRFQVEGVYGFNELEELTTPGAAPTGLSGEQHTASALLAVFADFPVSPDIQPFLGVGGGWSFAFQRNVSANSVSLGNDRDDGATAFGEVGVTFPLGQSGANALYLSYRFTRIFLEDSDQDSHGVKGGYRFAF